MRTLMTAAMILSLAAAPAFAADSAKVVLDRHVAAMKAGNLDAVMADYADNTVVIVPGGVVAGQKGLVVGEKGEALNVLDGKANARKFFAVLTAKESAPAMKSMTSSYEMKGNDTTLMHWKQFPGTAKEVSGTDVWVIRDGKIITQVVLVNPTKK